MSQSATSQALQKQTNTKSILAQTVAKFSLQINFCLTTPAAAVSRALPAPGLILLPAAPWTPPASPARLCPGGSAQHPFSPSRWQASVPLWKAEVSPAGRRCGCVATRVCVAGVCRVGRSFCALSELFLVWRLVLGCCCWGGCWCAVEPAVGEAGGKDRPQHAIAQGVPPGVVSKRGALGFRPCLDNKGTYHPSLGAGWVWQRGLQETGWPMKPSEARGGQMLVKSRESATRLQAGGWALGSLVERAFLPQERVEWGEKKGNAPAPAVEVVPPRLEKTGENGAQWLARVGRFSISAFGHLRAVWCSHHNLRAEADLKVIPLPCETP